MTDEFTSTPHSKFFIQICSNNGMFVLRFRDLVRDASRLIPELDIRSKLAHNGVNHTCNIRFSATSQETTNWFVDLCNWFYAIIQSCLQINQNSGQITAIVTNFLLFSNHHLEKLLCDFKHNDHQLERNHETGLLYIYL